MKRIAAAVIILGVLAFLLWPRDAAPPAAAAAAKQAIAPPTRAPVSPPTTAVTARAARPQERPAAANEPQAPGEETPARPDGGGAALFGPLVSMGQGYALSEALTKNAARADEYVDKLCEDKAKLRANPPMADPQRGDRDAAQFMAPLIDYEKPLDQPPGRLHLSDDLKAKIAKGWPDWSQQISDADLAALDFSWLTDLQQFDHWSLLSAGRLKDHPMTDFFSTPIPNYVSLMQWAKLRYALARRRGDHAQASAEVRHLADLVRSQSILIAEAVAVAIYKIDASARQGAINAGADTTGWPAPDNDSLDLDRKAAFASMYFTYPGVKPETLRRAMGCAPAPCVALSEGAGANRAFGAFAAHDNLQLVLELAKANHCEQAVFDRAARSNEVTAQEAWQALGGDLDTAIPNYLGAR